MTHSYEQILLDDDINELRAALEKSQTPPSVTVHSQNVTKIPYSNIPILHAAAYYNAYDCFTVLVQDKGYDAFQLYESFYTPLHYALAGCANEIIAFIFWIIDNNPNRLEELQQKIFESDYRNLEGKPSLIHLCAAGDCENGIDELFEHGYSYDKIQPQDRRKEPITTIVKSKKRSCLAKILKYYPKTDLKVKVSNLSPLMTAAINGFEEGVRLLLETGESPDQYSSINNMSMLDMVCMNSEINTEIASLIITHSTNLDGFPQSPPIISVCASKNKDIALMTINRNIDVNRTKNGIGALNHLIMWQNEDDAAEVLQMMLKKGFKVNPDNIKITPAASCLNTLAGIKYKLLELLIQYGADLTKHISQSSPKTIKLKLIELSKIHPEAKRLCEMYNIQ